MQAAFINMHVEWKQINHIFVFNFFKEIFSRKQLDLKSETVYYVA